jgi:thiamine phosphate synthase YjbQ (UPF0047 family)
MPDRPIKDKSPTNPSSQKSAQAAEQERRAAFRHALVVTAEAEELPRGIKLPARISDLSVHGCYLDTLNPFVPGTRLRIRLMKDNETFHSLAVVVYSHNGMGMGVAFTDVDPGARETIQKWLTKLVADKQVQTHSNSQQDSVPGASDDSGMIERLVHILVNKGLLTQEEAKGIFS